MKNKIRNIKNILENNNNVLLLLVGIPLSGKSTFVNLLFKELGNESNSINVISRDDILMNESNESNYEKAFNTVNQKEVTKKLNAKLEMAKEVKSGRWIIDMTQLSEKRRKHHLSFFKNYYKVAIVFPIPNEAEINKRNLKREKSEGKYISKVVIEHMLSKYSPVKKQEGFDLIIKI